MSDRSLSKSSKATRLLLDVGDEIGFLFDGVHAPSKALKYGREWREVEASVERAEQRRVLRQLERKQLLKIREKIDKNAKRDEVALTDRGKGELLRLRVSRAELLPVSVVSIEGVNLALPSTWYAS